MLDLVIETPRDPPEEVADHGHRRGDVDRRAQLVGGELVTPARAFPELHRQRLTPAVSDNLEAGDASGLPCGDLSNQLFVR